MSEKAKNGDLIKRRYADWERRAKDGLSHKPDGHTAWGKTLSGEPVKPLYTPLDTKPEGYLSELSFPGDYPYTRGIDPLMYRDKLWVMGQYSGFRTAEETNRRLKYLIDKGQTGFSIAMDLPTQLGLDSDYPLARGEVGKAGVAIDSLQDMEILLKGLPFDKIRQIRTTANSIGPIALALFVVVAQKNGIDPAQLRVLIQNDVLKEYTARGTYIFPPRDGVRFCVDALEYCVRNLPGWTPISVAGYHIREAGSTAAQEIACTLINARTYIDEALSRGLDIDDVAPMLYSMQSTQLDLFEEVAKLRALRRAWARMLKARYGAAKKKSLGLRLFCFTGGSSLTAQQPLNNVVRVTLEALAAVLGGAQTLHTSSYDEALGLPTETAVQLALRIQQILAHESGAALTCDPLGGSYYLEFLTDSIEKKAQHFMYEIEKQGGNIAAIENGFIQDRISRAAYELQRRIETNERVVVGVNAYESEPGQKIELHKADPEAERRQIESLNRIRAERPQEPARAALAGVRSAAKAAENTVPAIIDAVRAYATVGEIVGELADVWGLYRQN
ncbi:MAG: methylmalonyl-CoA mutase [Deltaproteobacteria bacterium]|nr:methylmalonyl-CoA mutase [Deltaproteobacteria bacterium]MBW2050172.1 methylmalonyl-CoA mutase [Deltaproteobacteria bacterium]